MNKAQLTSLAADQVALSKATARPVVAAVFSTIGKALARGENVSIADFGTFTPQDPRSGSCAAPRSRSALVAVVAPLSGAGRRGLLPRSVPQHPRRARP